MCGRYLRRSDKQRLAEAFRIANDLSEIVLPDSDYNVAPTTWQPIIRLDQVHGGRELALMRWGLVPSFAKSLNHFNFNTINAKAESLATSRTWQGPLQQRRCLVPADGFYEWKIIPPEEAPVDLFGVSRSPRGKQKPLARKQPYVFTLKTNEPFAFAGLWDRWRDPIQPGVALESFTIITTDPNELTATVHTRMPAILAPQHYAAWLNSQPGERPPVELLRPFPAEQMHAAPAHPDVGNVRNNHANLLNSEAINSQ